MIDEVKQHGNKLVDEVKSLWSYHIFKIGVVLIVISLLIWEVVVKSVIVMTSHMKRNLEYVVVRVANVKIRKLRKKMRYRSVGNSYYFTGVLITLIFLLTMFGGPKSLSILASFNLSQFLSIKCFPPLIPSPNVCTPIETPTAQTSCVIEL